MQSCVHQYHLSHKHVCRSPQRWTCRQCMWDQCDCGSSMIAHTTNAWNTAYSQSMKHSILAIHGTQHTRNPWNTAYSQSMEHSILRMSSNVQATQRHMLLQDMGWLQTPLTYRPIPYKESMADGTFDPGGIPGTPRLSLQAAFGALGLPMLIGFWHFHSCYTPPQQDSNASQWTL
jgi:hypothetical protein